MEPIYVKRMKKSAFSEYIQENIDTIEMLSV